MYDVVLHRALKHGALPSCWISLLSLLHELLDYFLPLCKEEEPRSEHLTVHCLLKCMKKILRKAWKERSDADQQEVIEVGMAYGCLLSQKLKECSTWTSSASLQQAIIATLDACVDTRSHEISVFRGITPTDEHKLLAHLCVLRRKCKAMKGMQREMKQQLLYDLSNNHPGDFTTETGCLLESV